uniref:DUF4283 domain-containing protein n=1 Tax=Kalanchoe fedtschenkoi TaxID=63787 RepID=A0A7N0VDR4_KALFE
MECGKLERRVFDGRQPPEPRPPDAGVDSQTPSENENAPKQSYATINRQVKPALFPTIELLGEIHAYTQQLKYALIAKFSNRRPHISMVDKEFRSWKLDGQPIVSDMDGQHVPMILPSEKDVITAFTQAPRRVRTSLFRLFRWTPEFYHKQESTLISAWVCFPRLRPDLFNGEYFAVYANPSENSWTQMLTLKITFSWLLRDAVWRLTL